MGIGDLRGKHIRSRVSKMREEDFNGTCQFASGDLHKCVQKRGCHNLKSSFHRKWIEMINRIEKTNSSNMEKYNDILLLVWYNKQETACSYL